MTLAIAVTGKTGSGKTTVVKAFLNCIKELYPDKSILLVDNDQTFELANSFNIEVKSTVYGIRIGKHEHRMGVPEGMSKQEFVDWAIHEILINVEDGVDLVVSGMVGAKCPCAIVEYINSSLKKLIKSYDVVIFDCEYDLKYLNQLVDYPPDTTLIVCKKTLRSIYTASKVAESSQKYASPGQMGILFNKVRDNGKIPDDVKAVMMEYDLELIGSLPYDDSFRPDDFSKESVLLTEKMKEIIYRLNLPML